MNIDKQARLVSSARISEIAKGANLIMGEKEWLANTAIYLANELKTATKAFQSTGFSLLEAEEKLEAAEKRIAELETQKADLMEHVLNGYEATALTMTLRKMDSYLPDYLRFCGIYGVDHDAIIDKLDYQSFVLKRVNNKDLKQDIEAAQ
ncbi:hypothetical protein GQ213_000014 [Salmonella enterica]|nr:hypothetical protein [Salmonella enterica]